MHSKYSNRNEIVFLILVQREPHAGRMGFRDIPQPTTLAERIALATRMKDELGLSMPVYVDSMRDESRELYSQLPGPVFIIAPDRRIIAKFPWAEASWIETALTAL